MKTTLLWDGKDQTRQHVPQGTYTYEARAKLMAHEEGFTKAKIVSPLREERSTCLLLKPSPSNPRIRNTCRSYQMKRVPTSCKRKAKIQVWKINPKMPGPPRKWSRKYDRPATMADRPEY